MHGAQTLTPTTRCYGRTKVVLNSHKALCCCSSRMFRMEMWKCNGQSRS